MKNECLKPLFFGKRGLRSGWKMFSSVVLFLSIACLMMMAIVPFFGERLAAASEWDSPYILALYLILLGSALISSSIMVRFVDGRPCASLGYSFDRGWIQEILIGTSAGFIIIGMISVSGFVSGVYRISPNALDPATLAGSFCKYALIIFIFAVFEEVLFRGYLLQTFIEGSGKILSVLVLSAIFGMFHYLNPNGSIFGVINTGLAGVLLSVTYIKTRSLWMPSFLHFSWNFSLGFFFGFPVSGIGFKDTLMTVEVSGSPILSGGEFGPEASIFTTVFLLAAIVLFLAARTVRPSDAMNKRWNEYRKRFQDDIR